MSSFFNIVFITNESPMFQGVDGALVQEEGGACSYGSAQQLAEVCTAVTASLDVLMHFEVWILTDQSCEIK